jgi:hypothetical protein
MKKILFVLSIIGILNSCTKKDKDVNFFINGKVEGMRKGMVYLKSEVNGSLVTVDSLFLKGTEDFEFKGNIESPEVFYLSTSRRNSSSLPIFVEQGEITVEANIKDLLAANIKGSENQKLLDQFNKIIGRFNTRKNELYAKGLQANSKKHFKTLNSISNQYRNNEIKKTRYILNFAVSNGDYDIAPYVALNYLSSSDITVLDTINKSMSAEVKLGKYGKELNELVTQLKITTIGNKLPEIVQPDTTGTKHKLENKKGYLLLRFWGSFDRNSRISKNISKILREKYSDDDLKIIGISLDSNKKDWVAAVKEDNVPWLQVSDLKSYNNEAVSKLAIRVIPENVLVDENGIIVGRNISKEDISKLIDTFIKNKKETEDKVKTESK